MIKLFKLLGPDKGEPNLSVLFLLKMIYNSYIFQVCFEYYIIHFVLLVV